MFLCFLVAMASLCHAQVPQAEMMLNGSSFARGGFFSATFRLDRLITQPFTVFSVIIMPDGSMLDALTLGPDIKPLASNVSRLDSPFSYPLLSLNLPAGAPLGQYEVVAAFFDPSKPITGRQAAFLDVSGKFEIVGGDPGWYLKYGPDGTDDIAQIGTLYTANWTDSFGCAYGGTMNWDDAMAWADGLNWLEKSDWRLATKNELDAICDAWKNPIGKVWSSTEWGPPNLQSYAAWVTWLGMCVGDLPTPKIYLQCVRAVRDVE